MTTISDLIKVLQDAETNHGDVPIYLVVDEQLHRLAENRIDSIVFIEKTDCSKMTDIQKERYVNLVWQCPKQ